jgi:mycothione reductase
VTQPVLLFHGKKHALNFTVARGVLMKEYDVIVIGAGEGLGIVFKALAAGHRVALVDKGHVGGTCLNVGCVPSKTLIYPADRIREIESATKLGITARITRIDFASLMKRVRNTRRESRQFLLEEINNSKKLDFYNEEARFIGDYTLQTKTRTIRGRKIFIVSGSRPVIPPLEGLDGISYLTNENIPDLTRKPQSMIIIGGGYIGVEYGHFFSAMGIAVTIVQSRDRLLPVEEPEISDLLGKVLARRMSVITNAEALEVTKKGKECTLAVRDTISGRSRRLKAETILVATGRRSNADLLSLEKTGVDLEGTGYIKVDDMLQTSRENIWAFGDAIGKAMFTHAGDMEHRIAWHNAAGPDKIKMDFSAVPHAVYTHPQIASVGLTEEQARKSHEILVGRANYSDVVQGNAMMEEEGFAKAIVEKGTEKILGFHVIGPMASVLIQEVVNAVAAGGDVKSITERMHIFPAMSELIPETLRSVK